MNTIIFNQFIDSWKIDLKYFELDPHNTLIPIKDTFFDSVVDKKFFIIELEAAMAIDNMQFHFDQLAGEQLKLNNLKYRRSSDRMFQAADVDGYPERVWVSNIFSLFYQLL